MEKRRRGNVPEVVREIQKGVQEVRGVPPQQELQPNQVLLQELHCEIAKAGFLGGVAESTSIQCDAGCS